MAGQHRASPRLRLLSNNAKLGICRGHCPERARLNSPQSDQHIRRRLGLGWRQHTRFTARPPAQSPWRRRFHQRPQTLQQTAFQERSCEFLGSADGKKQLLNFYTGQHTHTHIHTFSRHITTAFPPIQRPALHWRLPGFNQSHILAFSHPSPFCPLCNFSSSSFLKVRHTKIYRTRYSLGSRLLAFSGFSFLTLFLGLRCVFCEVERVREREKGGGGWNGSRDCVTC